MYSIGVEVYFQKHQDLISGIEIRAVSAEERSRWIELCNAHHYLGFKGCFGYSILYCAVYKGKWVGLLSWSASALALKMRDEWIGWTPSMRLARSNLVLNNSRFLILPEFSKIQNLASRILSLNIKRLRKDWFNRFKLKPVLCETFVDPTRFHGGCYRASGWQEIGQTAGYKRTVGGFSKDSTPKKIFVFPLHHRALNILRNPNFVDVNGKEQFLFDVYCLPIEGRGGLIDALEYIEDPRSRLGRQHSLVSILGIAAGAMLSGAQSFKAIGDWSKQLSTRQLGKLRCRKKTPPSLTTIKETIYRIDTEQFDQVIYSWLSKLALTNTKAKCLSIDGKVLRGSRKNHPKKNAVQLLSALLHKERITVSQRQIANKTNEIPMVNKLLEDIEDLSETCVTLDALHCQKETMKYINRRRGSYVITVKENQKNFLSAIKETFELFEGSYASIATEKNNGHGRNESRNVASIDISPEDAETLGFESVRQIAKVDRSATIKSLKKSRSETAYLVSNKNTAELTAAEMLVISRGHWQIENSSHHVRDVTMKEDHSQIRTESAPRVMATFRNLTIGILRVGGEENIASGIRQNAWKPKSTAIRALGAR